MRSEKHDYHRDRVREELDLSYRARSRRAAEAHLRLSSLHMQRLEELNAAREDTWQPAMSGGDGSDRGRPHGSGIGSAAIIAASLYTGGSRDD